MKNKPVAVAMEDYDSACENYVGWCTACRGFTTDSVEPDAERYVCDVCEKQTVYGAEMALVHNLIEFE
jgi:hypothetical protein